MKETIEGPTIGVDLNEHMYQICDRLETEFLQLLKFYKLDSFTFSKDLQIEDPQYPHNKQRVYRYGSGVDSGLELVSTFKETIWDDTTYLRMSLNIIYKFHHLNYLL